MYKSASQKETLHSQWVIEKYLIEGNQQGRMQYTVTISRPKGAKEGEQLPELERTAKWWGRPHRSLLWPYEEDIQWTSGNLAGGRQKRPRNKYLLSFPIPSNVLLVSFPSALPLSHTQEDGRGQRNLYNCGSLFFFADDWD